jgi:hypothetical protein
MLHLSRRHRRDCKSSHAEDSFNSEFDERRKGWKRCECPIVASGTLNKKYRRQSTGKWEWETARAESGAKSLQFLRENRGLFPLGFSLSVDLL